MHTNNEKTNTKINQLKIVKKNIKFYNTRSTINNLYLNITHLIHYDPKTLEHITLLNMFKHNLYINFHYKLYYLNKKKILTFFVSKFFFNCCFNIRNW